jgi:predicted ATPase/class 3 adenylate cyclase
VAGLPSGTVTFLFSDIEGSTRLWERFPDEMSRSAMRHDELLREAIGRFGGAVFSTAGDGVGAAFGRAGDAVNAAIEVQRLLGAELWPASAPIRVRIGLHTGEAEERNGDYFGPAVNRAARLMAVGHGGQILCSQVTADIVRDAVAADVTLVDLDEHRLRDLVASVHVFQIVHPELRAEFPPLRSLDALPGNLPRQLTSFVGREHEIEQVLRAVRERSLVTLTGVGGVGKTRLAQQCAAGLLTEYRDGVWFCELAAATDAESMAEVVASTLGAALRPGNTLLESIIEFLRNRSVTLVLDNCEHLLEPTAELVERIARTCPRVAVIVTSRELLGVAGEWVLPLRSLRVPAAMDLESVTESDAIRLFVDRATAVNRDFRLDATNAPATVEICRRLDGIPLAIELAAARIATMSPAEIANHLDERFRLLTGGRRSAVERHHTLRAAVDWSYSLLDQRERIVFGFLSVCAGGFDADAAVAICAVGTLEDWDVLDGLALLATKSMVVTENRAGRTRYSLLETMRQYGRERLDESHDADSTRRRHAAHYATVAEAIRAGLFSAEEHFWRANLREELDNLRAAVTWSLNAGDADAETAERIVAALADAAAIQRSYGISAWAEQVRTSSDTFDVERHALVVACAALHAIDAGDPETAHVLALQAIGDDLSPICTWSTLPYTVLSVSYALLGDPRRGFEILDAVASDKIPGLRISDVHRNTVATVAALWAAMAGDTARARAGAGKSLEAARAAGIPSMMYTALFLHAWVTWKDDPYRAMRELEESIALSLPLGGSAVLGISLALLAQLRAQEGDPSAATVLRDAVLRGHDIGRPQVMSVLDRAIRVCADLAVYEVVAVLGGVLERGPLGRLSIVPSDEMPDRQAAIAAAREHLGEAAYESAVTRGAALTYEQLESYALATIEQLVSDDTPT